MPAEPTKPAPDASTPASAPAPAPEPVPAAPSPAAPPLQVQSLNPLPQPTAGEPSMGMGRLRAYRANPGPETEKYARELVERCGPLVLDGVQYRIRDGRFEGVTVEQLAVERMRQQTSKDEIETPDLGPGA